MPLEHSANVGRGQLPALGERLLYSLVDQLLDALVKGTDAGKVGAPVPERYFGYLLLRRLLREVVE